MKNPKSARATMEEWITASDIAAWWHDEVGECIGVWFAHPTSKNGFKGTHFAWMLCSSEGQFWQYHAAMKAIVGRPPITKPYSPRRKSNERR